VIDELRRKIAMIVVWRVTDRCNLSCSFCAFDKRLAFPRTQTDPAEVMRFAKLLADYQSRTGDKVLLSWLGGEPLLWEPLERLTHDARALGLQVSATTNGTTLGSRHIRRHLCESYKELTISIDGFAALHDPMRGWNGGFDKLRCWIPVLANEIRMLASPLKLRANVVLMRQNIGDFPALCLELAHWGIKEITFNQLGGRDRPEFYPTHRLRISDVDALAAQLPGIRGQLKDFGTSLIGGSNYLKRIYASAEDRPNPVNDCDPCADFLFIDEKGMISPCSFTSRDYGVDVRTITTSSELAALSGRFRLMQRMNRSVQCNDCLSTQVCDKFKRAEISTPEAVPAYSIFERSGYRFA
jgi:MoaA/NifB/PqqE/SkfB family radical SAM enzyme